MSESQIVAFTWFVENEYGKLLEKIRDTEPLFDTYEAWKKDARKTLMKLKKMGLEPRRVYIETEQFVAWCRRRNQRIDHKALEMFKEIKRQSFYAQLDDSGPQKPADSERQNNE